MVRKMVLAIFTLFAGLTFLLPAAAAAQDKVVVIPMFGDDPAPLEPFCPVTADSPPDSAYTDNGDGTVTDTVTGLQWQKTDDDTQRTREEAWNYCQDRSLGGKTDWRLPSVDELMSIVDYGGHDPAINGTAFTGTNPDSYWSATPGAASGTSLLVVSFLEGKTFYAGVTKTNYVRCVRGNFAGYGMFEDNGDGTVTCLATGLTWQQEVVEEGNVNNTWAEAVTYCQELPLSGGGWRLPTIKELLSIVDRRVYEPARDSDVFPLLIPVAYWSPSSWSATTKANNTGSAWFVNFVFGEVDYIEKTFSYHHVRCVR